jgi:hypothetical protein
MTKVVNIIVTTIILSDERKLPTDYILSFEN